MADWTPPNRIDDYVKLPKEELVTLRPADLVAIEANAHILDADQCLDFLSIRKEALNEAEMYYVAFAHKKGQARHIASACTKLFNHMDTKTGGSSALEYLKAKQVGFAKIEVKPGGNGGFSFNVVMTE